ncbi:MAG: hypothetical protein HFF84_14630 [Oscillibacter sp.]|nr:hypothetical protein [Oscillibacter sp.]
MDYSWEEELTPDMLGDNLYCTVAKAIGVENLLRLAKIIGGSNFYMPIEKGLLRPLRNKKIAEEYNGYNKKELAKKYGVTPRMVQNIATSNAADKAHKIKKKRRATK